MQIVCPHPCWWLSTTSLPFLVGGVFLSVSVCVTLCLAVRRLCLGWCERCVGRGVMCVVRVGGKRGEESEPSLTKNTPNPSQKRRARWTFQRFSVIHIAPRHVLVLSCYCGTNMAAGFIQQRFFWWWQDWFGFGRSTIPTLSQVVTSSQHIVNNTHRVLGTHCTDVISTHQEFDSPQTRCGTVLDSPFFLCTLHSQALAVVLPQRWRVLSSIHRLHQKKTILNMLLFIRKVHEDFTLCFSVENDCMKSP